MSNINLYDPLDQSDLKNRIMRISGPIGVEMYHTVNRKLSYFEHSKSKSPVTLYLNSPGGHVPDGLAIYDNIRTIAKKIPINIVTYGSCMSMGAIVLQAGTQRISMPNTSFLLHQLSMATEGQLGALKDQHEQALRLQHQLDGIILERTGLTAKHLKKLVERRDYFLTAEEALEWKLIDKIAE